MPTPIVTPVSPTSGESLLPQTSPIIVEVTEPVSGVNPASLKVTVNGSLVYNGFTPAFLLSWTGSVITRPQGDGYRIVLNSPTPFPDQQRVDVMVEATAVDATVMTPFLYSFFVQIRQVTFTGDVSVPRVVEAGAVDNLWLGYSRNGSTYLRRSSGGVLDPEVQVVPGDILDVGYDATLNKFVMVYAHQGKVFYILADTTDAPASVPQPSTLRSEVRGYMSTQGAENDPAFNLLYFEPLKLVTPLETLRKFLSDGGDGGPTVASGPTTMSSALTILPQEPGQAFILRFFRPSDSFENAHLLGWNLYKVIQGVLHPAVFVPYSPAIPEFTEVLDETPLTNVLYGLSSVLRNTVTGEMFETVVGALRVPPQPPAFGALGGYVQKYMGSSDPPDAVFGLVFFEPLKMVTPPETCHDYLGDSAETLLVAVSGFDPIGVG